MPRALVIKSKSVRSVAQGADDTVSLVDACTLTNGVSVAWLEDGQTPDVKEWKHQSGWQILQPGSYCPPKRNDHGRDR